MITNISGVTGCIISMTFCSSNILIVNSRHKFSPFLAARMPPVSAPLVIEFHGSSFCRRYTSEQSIVENMPPHTAKFPATIGDLSLIAAKLPI